MPQTPGNPAINQFPFRFADRDPRMQIYKAADSIEVVIREFKFSETFQSLSSMATVRKK
jgi:hypothetical protein